MQARDWSHLTNLSQGQPLVVERVRLVTSEIAVEGSFRLPDLACLSADDQVFVAAFIRCHGSIKQMERWFGVSYPTIKNRLRRISEALPLVQHLTNDEDAERDAGADSARAAAPDQLAADAPDSPLQRLAQGEITVAEAAAALRGRR